MRGDSSVVGGRSRTISPGGFTLVELLVAMAIFSLLAVLTISAFRGNDSDRISAATSTFRNALEGARSRAIKSGQVRGLRLITDPIDGRIVRSMIYVGAPDPGYDEGSGIVINNGGIWNFRTTSTDWSAATGLNSRNLLTVPTRIEIPRDSGNWYIANVFDSNNTVALAGHFQPSRWSTAIAPSGGWAPIPTSTTNANQSQSMTYRIEMSPALLPGSEPILLPPNTCIDLDGSAIPWVRPTAAVNGSYGTSMDILFSPKGEITGPIKSKGILHFRIAAPADLLLARNVVTGLPNTTPNGNPVVVANPEHGQKLVSLFTQTGGVVISEVNIGTGSFSTFNDTFASNPYTFAIRGKEAK